MFPWKSVVEIEQTCPNPIYLQIANDIICEIKKGRVAPGSKLPGTRSMSQILEVHRKTVVAAYEEMEAQGWIDIHPSKGAFVLSTLPEQRPQQLRGFSPNDGKAWEQTGYEVQPYTNIHSPTYAPQRILGLHDGPDLRLVPRTLIARTFKGIMSRPAAVNHLRYYEVDGNPNLRQVLSEHLNESRGLKTTADNIFITRGSTMGIFLSGMALLSKGDVVLTGDPGYYYGERKFAHFGANIIRVPVDEFGMRTDIVEDICKKHKVRLLYVTPHHHFPTTVTLCASRRMELLALARQYRFAILEDDYDYDFHYQSSPLLPLASADETGNVIYIGSMSKTFAPFLRVGFMAAPKNLLQELLKMRQLIDIQGDYIMEQTVAELFKLGEIKRHMKKALKIYKERRDIFCEMLAEKTDGKIQFKIPEGGMTVWAQFDKDIPLPLVNEAAKKQGLIIPGGQIYDNASSVKLNSTRLGFAGVNLEEINRATDILGKAIRKIDGSKEK
ncbi:MAG: PLP-dependent aminotransferase family protein [Lewinellaceae bacterium]|nr:PLP-dependent aminotransferase family protein [Saprospiraceae bacterium]MCB9340895.1 PLP-dependent aminotransferase family protein [Lewinellaceae bacterium]